MSIGDDIPRRHAEDFSARLDSGPCRCPHCGQWYEDETEASIPNYFHGRQGLPDCPLNPANFYRRP